MTEIMSTKVAPSPERNASRVFLELPADAVKSIRGTKVGTPVRVMIQGKLASFTERKPEMGDISEGTVGSVSVEYSKIHFIENENEFLDLVDDD